MAPKSKGVGQSSEQPPPIPQIPGAMYVLVIGETGTGIKKHPLHNMQCEVRLYVVAHA